MTMDAEARLQRLLEQAPFVRALARNLLCDDVDEVVQQTWLKALQGDTREVTEPRSWLARVVRNVAANLRRERDRRRVHEAMAAVPDLVPSSAELMQREELRRELVTAVDRLPGELRTVVLLRWFEGLPPRAIAAELGLPVTTVWNRLRSSLALLREQLDARHGGDRRAWAVPIGAWAFGRDSAVATTAMVTGVIAMTTKTKLAAVALFLLLAVLVLWPDPTAATVTIARVPAATNEQLQAASTGDHMPAADAQVRSELAPATTAAATGELVVHVRYAKDQSVAAGVLVVLRRRPGDLRVGIMRAMTDATGTARFDSLLPGKLRCAALPARECKNVEVEANQTAELDLELRPEMHLTGIVVDAAGAPVGGAGIEFAACADGSFDAETVTTTAADGTFTLRCFGICVVGARAEGHGPSRMQFFLGNTGSTETARFVLGASGGSVAGVVMGPDGSPVRDAVVRMGEGRTDSVMAGPGRDWPPLPAQVRTDAEGHFLAFGVAPGPQPIRVRAAGFAPWQGNCDVIAHSTVATRAVLSGGFTCTGVVRQDDGRPLPDHRIVIGEHGAFVQFQAYSAADGTFTIRDLPPGDVELIVYSRGGMAAVRVHGEAGATVPCELQIRSGFVLRVQIVDQLGAPVANARVECRGEGSGEPWFAETWSGADGTLLVPQCPEGRTLSIRVRGQGIDERFEGIDPRGNGRVLKVRRDTSPGGKLTGVVVGPDGLPLPTAAVSVEGSGIGPVGADGRFALGVRAGVWRLQVIAKDYASIRLEAEVTAGATVDLGAVQLRRGGRVAAIVTGADARALRGTVHDERNRPVTSLIHDDTSFASELLMPASYRLCVHGPGCAARLFPFVIADGETTRVEVRAVSGTRQRFRFVRADGARIPLGFLVRVHAGGELLLQTPTEVHDGDCTADLWLVPGSYELLATCAELQGRATFTVAGEAAVMRVELR